MTTESASLTVAINAQLSVTEPGGVESNLASLIHEMGPPAVEDRFILLARPKHADELREIAPPNQVVRPWPYDDTKSIPHHSMSRRWSRLRARAGPLGRGVDVLHRVYRNLRSQRFQPTTAGLIDALLRRDGAQVVHFPYSIAFQTTLPFVYEPWDLLHRHRPQFFSRQEWEWREQTYGDACRRARLVVTATRWIKDDVVRQFAIPPERIAVIPRAPTLAWRRNSSPTAAPASELARLPAEFAFFPAMTFPHKNHLALLRALARLRDGHGVRLNLVCTGRFYMPHWPAVEAEVASLGLGSQVWFLGPVSVPALEELYKRARFMVFPSLFEGLGIPILEAFQRGLPVLAARSTCIPEVVQDSALLFDGTDVDAIAGAIRTALQSPSLLDELRVRGAGRLEHFCWKRASKRFTTCYRHAAGLKLSEEEEGILREILS